MTIRRPLRWIADSRATMGAMTILLATLSCALVRGEDAHSAQDPDEQAARKDVPATATRQIETSHRLTLENGSVIRANLLEESSEGWVCQLGTLGAFTIPKDSVASIVEERGTVEWEQGQRSEAGTRSTAGDEPGSEARTARETEQPMPGKEGAGQVGDDRRLSEILQAVEKAYPVWNEQVSQELRQELYRQARDLTQQDSRQRVRAENRLRGLGAVSLPWVDALSLHPFDLTRRAALRLVRDFDDDRGIPIALRALADPDEFVTKSAHEFLEERLDLGVEYDADRTFAERFEIQARYWDSWRETLRRDLESRLQSLDLGDGSSERPEGSRQ